MILLCVCFIHTSISFRSLGTLRVYEYTIYVYSYTCTLRVGGETSVAGHSAQHIVNKIHYMKLVFRDSETPDESQHTNVRNGNWGAGQRSPPLEDSPFVKLHVNCCTNSVVVNFVTDAKWANVKYQRENCRRYVLDPPLYVRPFNVFIFIMVGVSSLCLRSAE